MGCLAIFMFSGNSANPEVLLDLRSKVGICEKITPIDEDSYIS